MKSFLNVILVTFLLISSIDRVSANDMIPGAMEGLIISGKALDLDDYQLTLTFKFSPEVNACGVYSEPSHSLIILCSQEGSVSSKRNRSLSPIEQVANLQDDSIRVIIPKPDPSDSYFSVVTTAKKTKMENVFLELHTNAQDDFSFSVIHEPDSTGCMTMGKCGSGREFFGPYCDPCVYTLCCYGNYGFIQCGIIICP